MAPHVAALRHAWKRSGLTLAQIGARCGRSTNTVYLVMGGKRQVRADSVLAVAAVLGLASIPVPASAFPTSNDISV